MYKLMALTTITVQLLIRLAQFFQVQHCMESILGGTPVFDLGDRGYIVSFPAGPYTMLCHPWDDHVRSNGELVLEGRC